MKELTLQDLDDMKPGIFAQGETTDDPDGCNMTASGRKLKWVASRGDIHDWAIYVLWASCDWMQVKAMGDKIHDEANIRKLVPCTSEAFDMYRH